MHEYFIIEITKISIPIRGSSYCEGFKTIRVNLLNISKCIFGINWEFVNHKGLLETRSVQEGVMIEGRRSSIVTYGVAVLRIRVQIPKWKVEFLSHNMFTQFPLGFVRREIIG